MHMHCTVQRLRAAARRGGGHARSPRCQIAIGLRPARAARGPCPRRASRTMRPFWNGATLRRPWRRTSERMSAPRERETSSERFATERGWVREDQNNPRRKNAGGPRWAARSRCDAAVRILTAWPPAADRRRPWRPGPGRGRAPARGRATHTLSNLTRNTPRNTVAPFWRHYTLSAALLYAHKHSANTVLLHRLTFLWKINIHFPRV